MNAVTLTALAVESILTSFENRPSIRCIKTARKQ